MSFIFAAAFLGLIAAFEPWLTDDRHSNGETCHQEADNDRRQGAKH
jgi:hypothetical protein